MPEFDELRSFVLRRKNKRWVRLAQCAGHARSSLTSLVVAARRHAASCCTGRPGGWERIPQDYKASLLFTDFWAAYARVLPPEWHRATGKGRGQTYPIERLNNVLRQRLARFVRRTLSFSKSDVMHDNCLRLFLHEYNRPTEHQPRRLRLV